ncbi:SDR family oxidoreductase [Thermococcus radiotolerans]|uniref:Sugar dehydrogenase n=1 Tax=Thermococcus radiotolerans TaxID=187880 RepID=A0A2Z2N1X1_9EURY|nr:SDR family oxidoreductase [Thermococcus radiotolerans]ASJ15504.1 sugar dehydrogenase [Thermococcus radiotolerans]
MPVEINLDGLGVIVTASSRGIGFNVARELLKRNARVVVSSRNEENLKKALEKLSEYGEVYGVIADVGEKEDLENLVSKAWDALDGVDALVWNAPNVSCEPCLVHEADYADWLEAAKLHSIAPGYLTILLIRKWIENGKKGILVYLNSVSIKEPMPPLVLADVTRAGLVQLAKSVSRTYGKHGIRAHSVLLGSFDTPGARENLRAVAESRGEPFDETWEREVLGRTPLHRTGRWDELGSLVAFLLSEEAEYMLGSTVVIDGAMTRSVDL